MIKAAVLGATGLVGQRFAQFLDGHPWFRLTSVAAAPELVGKPYSEATHWQIGSKIPKDVSELELVLATPKDVGDVDVVFSALPPGPAGKIETDFAKAGFVVLSNASSHRMDPDVPILNPEVNADHVALIDRQRRERKWDGAIVTNPNCTAAILTLSLRPVQLAYGIERVIVSTMQAVSGAGYPGVASLDIVDNVIPYIEREEDKVRDETRKILGSLEKPSGISISASCHRVPTIDGHMEAVFVGLKKEAEPEDIVKIMKGFTGKPQQLKLPTAPPQPVVVREERDRPQTRLDRMVGRGMSVVVGRIRKDELMDGVKYVVVGHNTIRGAAGCSVLNAELLKTEGYL